MRTSASTAYALSAAVAIALLAGCSGGNSQVNPLAGSQSTARHTVGSLQVKSYSVLKNGTTQYSHKVAKSWMKHIDAFKPRLTYISDFNLNSVTVFGRNGQAVGQIGGLLNPQGLFVDGGQNLWVADTGNSRIQVFPRGSSSPSNSLSDAIGSPVDVTVCPNGTVYVSNILNFSTGTGNIQVYDNGATNPTRTLSAPGEQLNFFITCTNDGNVFSTILNGSGFPAVVAYAGGQQSGYSQLPISLDFPGGVKPGFKESGTILVDDQTGANITEYTEAGSPTGRSIHTTSGDIVDIGVTRDALVVGGTDTINHAGFSWMFPGGALRQTYRAGFPQPIGFAFDPGQPGLGS